MVFLFLILDDSAVLPPDQQGALTHHHVVSQPPIMTQKQRVDVRSEQRFLDTVKLS